MIAPVWWVNIGWREAQLLSLHTHTHGHRCTHTHTHTHRRTRACKSLDRCPTKRPTGTPSPPSFSPSHPLTLSPRWLSSWKRSLMRNHKLTEAFYTSHTVYWSYLKWKVFRNICGLPAARLLQLSLRLLLVLDHFPLWFYWSLRLSFCLLRSSSASLTCCFCCILHFSVSQIVRLPAFLCLISYYAEYFLVFNWQNKTFWTFIDLTTNQ